MGVKLQNVKGLFTDVKTRTIIIFTAALLVGGVLIGIAGFSHKTKTIPGTTSTGHVPQIASVPGVVPAPSLQYEQAQIQANAQSAALAKQTGTSAIPTIVGNAPQQQPKQVANTNAQVNALAQQPTQANLTPLPNVLPGTYAGGADQSQQAQAMRQAVNKQIVDMFNAWNKVTPQSYTEAAGGSGVGGAGGAAGTGHGYAGGGGGAGGNVGPVQPAGPPLLRAGDILFGVLDTAVDSDEPGPVLATVIGGPLQGAKLLGDMKVAGPNADRVNLSFHLVNLPDSTKSYSISAIAIDPDTARTALATKVNYHYLLRYGSLFASSFLTGYGNAVGRTNQTTTVSPFGSTTTQSGNLTPKQEFLTALGTVGQQWGGNLAPIMSTPPTIMVASGTSVGILVLADFHQK